MYRVKDVCGGDGGDDDDDDGEVSGGKFEFFFSTPENIKSTMIAAADPASFCVTHERTMKSLDDGWRQKTAQANQDGNINLPNFFLLAVFNEEQPKY